MTKPVSVKGGTPIKVLVCGSRDGWRRRDYLDIFNRLSQLPAGSVVIHGAARGVDRFAGACAEAFGLEEQPFPADWAQYGKRAGVIRNSQMLDLKPDVVLAFWNGQSRGTKHTIDEAERRGIEVEVLP